MAKSMAKLPMPVKMIIVAVVLLVFLFAFSVAGWGMGIAITRSATDFDFSALANQSEKVILFIGDGMGQNHVKLTSTYYDKTLYMTTLDYSGLVTTYSNSLLSATDSAAAGSALATGRKYDNGEVARHDGKDVQSISEQAKAKGLGVGIVTTDSLTGATPAAFSSHANNRGDNQDIMLGQLANGFDLYLGKTSGNHVDAKQQWVDDGYSFVDTFDSLSVESDKIIGVFSSIVANNGTNETPTLEMLTEFAIAFMEAKYPNGYFLMIEGAHIDKMSHDNLVFEMMEYLVSFDNCVNYAHNTLMEENISIIVTADHETGWLKYTDKTDKISNDLYQNGGHSSRHVPYYAYINTKDSVDVASVLPYKIDNTDVYKMCKTLLLG